MKQILLKIDEKVFKGLQAEIKLREFAEGCVAPPTGLEKAMIGIIKKIESGAAETTLALKGKPVK